MTFKEFLNSRLGFITFNLFFAAFVYVSVLVGLPA